MSRLATSSLLGLAHKAITPTYDRSSVKAGHAHIGVGNFHRAHQAVYADDLLAIGSRNDGIVGFSMRSPGVIEALTPQDLLYSVTEVSSSGPATRIIGSLCEMCFVPGDPAAAIARLADPAVGAITITVTEAGYCWRDDTQSLNTAHPDIVHDIERPASPRTMPGLVVAALARRIENRIALPVVVPCDNIIDNGRVTRTLLTQLAAEQSQSLARAISQDLEVCSTMVDRMVPGVTRELANSVNERLGVRDALPLITEPFRQWVVQDSPAIRHWGDAGVDIVTQTGTHERLKLYVLNGLHSAFAYLGLRLGHGLVSDAVNDPRLRAIVQRILDDEIVPSVVPPPGTSSAQYAAQVLDRFAEPSLGYTTRKVASDGALKLQQRVLPTVRACLEAGRPVDGLALVIAAWGWAMFGPDCSALAVEDDWLIRELGSTPRPRGSVEFISWLLSSEALLADLAGSFRLRSALERQAARIWAEPPQLYLDQP